MTHNGREVVMKVTINRRSGVHTVENVGQVACEDVHRLTDVQIGRVTDEERAGDCPINVNVDLGNTN